MLAQVSLPDCDAGRANFGGGAGAERRVPGIGPAVGGQCPRGSAAWLRCVFC